MEVPIGASEIVHSGSSCRFSSGSEMHGNFLAISDLARLTDPGFKELIGLHAPFIVLSIDATKFGAYRKDIHGRLALYPRK